MSQEWETDVGEISSAETVGNSQQRRGGVAKRKHHGRTKRPSRPKLGRGNIKVATYRAGEVESRFFTNVVGSVAWFALDSLLLIVKKIRDLLIIPMYVRYHNTSPKLLHHTLFWLTTS